MYATVGATEQQTQTSTLKFVCPVVTRMGTSVFRPFFFVLLNIHNLLLGVTARTLESNLSCVQSQLPLVLFDFVS